MWVERVGNALQFQTQKIHFLPLILLTFFTCSFPLTLTSSNDSSFTAILDVLLLVFSELDEKVDDKDDESEDDFVCGAGDAVCDAAESVKRCDDLFDDDTNEDDDDGAPAASSGVRMSGIFPRVKQKEY